jgi:hypothetical protein
VVGLYVLQCACLGPYSLSLYLITNYLSSNNQDEFSGVITKALSTLVLGLENKLESDQSEYDYRT